MKRRALISVSDKTGIVEFAEELVKLDYEIISTGGTKNLLEAQGIPTLSVEAVTGFPEMLDGRVKTLHPMIHGGLLAIRTNEVHQAQVEQHEISYIDLVCVNLYPFKETILKPNCTYAEAVENIDIGGPSMLRSSAKNHRFVTVVCDQADYAPVLQELKEYGQTKLITRERLAAKVFRLTASYDAMIAQYFTDFVEEEEPELLTLTYAHKQALRYGENPHQKASFYESILPAGPSIAQAKQLHGKELSYNNIQDANAALQMVQEFSDCAVVAVKHMNPCGIGTGSRIEIAYQKAYEADPVSIFGGIVALNREVTYACAKQMSELFLEVIIAPSYSEEALEVLQKKKNIRLLIVDLANKKDIEKQVVSVSGGLLVQDKDQMQSNPQNWKVATKKTITEEQQADLVFGEAVVKHVKSNAIVIVKDGSTIGIGAGQMNRVGAAKIALEQAGVKAQGAILASDAFFPMDDTVRLAAEYGIAAIIQPGGSIKDQDSIQACDELGMAMVLTGLRHFKH